jgi:hypothetical protein
MACTKAPHIGFFSSIKIGESLVVCCFRHPAPSSEGNKENEEKAASGVKNKSQPLKKPPRKL